MSYIVTQTCFGNKHTSCVDVCPVDAFREGPEMLYIDPNVCIDCNACVSACPEQAIYSQSNVPNDQQSFIALNAEKAAVYPVIRESINQTSTLTGQHQQQGSFAVVGSGPSGFFTAEALLKQMPGAKVDIFERLPTPFGLVRYGVAPDHPKIKSVSAGFERIAEFPQVRFFGNVTVGEDLELNDLLNHYHGVIYATGGSQSRVLNIPGAELPNIFGSSNFVGWYNGHPDQQTLPVDLNQRTVVVIGMGNVALDIARILVLPSSQLATTDMADNALAALSKSQVEEVYLLARRGPVQAAFTPKELEQLMAMPELDLIVDPEYLKLDQTSEALLEQAECSEARRNVALLQQISERPLRGGKKIHLVFSASPEHIRSTPEFLKTVSVLRNTLQTDNHGVITAVPTSNSFEIEAGLIIHATGYQGETIADLPFNDRYGTIQNIQGKVLRSESPKQTPEYVAGWIKRGANGVIGTNKQCANDSVALLLADLPDRLEPMTKDISSLLTEKNIPYVSFSDWRLLDEHEQTLGRTDGRPRKKITTVAKMLAVIEDAKLKALQKKENQAELPIQTHYRSCTLCEAMCGVKIEYQGEKILSVSGDKQDPHSQGHICPKGYSLQDLHNDPDRLKTPLEKVNGEWQAISWEDAFDKVAERLFDIQSRHGNDSVAGYWGNPGSHNLGLLMGSNGLRQQLASRNMFSAASFDQMPHQLCSYLMLGHGQIFTIPDIDRTDYMLMLGANPAASNGSLMTAGDIIKRLETIQHRGGKVVLLDPRRTETARYVSEHHFIKPASDPLFLIGLIQHIINNDLFEPAHLTPILDGWDELLALFGSFSMDEISAQCGIPSSEIIRIAEEFSAAPSAVCYGRMGVSTQQHSTLNHWLMLVLNIITGNLDRPGGMMFTTPAFDKPMSRPMGSFNTYQSRVRGLPEFARQLPSTVMAEEMLTPGEGQIKAFVCVAGNPVLSAPNGRMIDQAIKQLDFMVSIDFFLNETSRHADIILPPTGPLEHEQYDIVYNFLAVRNLSRFTEALFTPGENTRCDWDIVQGLANRLKALKNPEKSDGNLTPKYTPTDLLEEGLRDGPYCESFTEYNGDKPIKHNEGLSLSVLKRYPHGLDLGAMQPRLPEMLFTEDKKIKLMPEVVIKDFHRLIHDRLPGNTKPESQQPLVLINRRDLRTNNSWMHNCHRLVKGKDRCGLMLNPEDGLRLGLGDQDQARIVSRVGELMVRVELTDEVMPGVTCLPHGWGHDLEGIRLRVAQNNPGINVNVITDEQLTDELSGNAIFTGIEVQVIPAESQVINEDENLM